MRHTAPQRKGGILKRIALVAALLFVAALVVACGPPRYNGIVDLLH